MGFMPWLLTAVGFVWPQVFDAFMPEDTDFPFGRMTSVWSFKVFVETKRRFLFSPAEAPLYTTAHGARAWHPLFLALTPLSALLLTPLSSSLRFLSSPICYVFSRFFSSLFLFSVPSHFPSCLFSLLLSSFLFFSLLLSSCFILSPLFFLCPLLFSSLLFASLLCFSLLV